MKKFFVFSLFIIILFLLAFLWPKKESTQVAVSTKSTASSTQKPAATTQRTTPEQTKPADSPSLSALKDALNSPYQGQMQMTKNGNITSFDTVDKNQQLALRIIMTNKDKDVTDWLKGHLGDYDPIYLYAMAYRMANLQAPAEEFFFWASAGHLRALADQTLCKDPYVGQYLSILQMDILQPGTQLYAQNSEAQNFLANKDLLVQTMKKAISWDIQHPQTNSPDWFCKSGHAVTTTDTYPQNEWHDRRISFKKQQTESLYQ